MDINHLLNAVFDASANISIDLNFTFPITLATLGALHLRKKISEKRAKDKNAQSLEDTKENVAHPQLATKEGATCPQIRTKDKPMHKNLN